MFQKSRFFYLHIPTLLLFLFFIPQVSATATRTSLLSGIDTFGSKHISIEKILDFAGPELEKFTQAKLSGDFVSADQFQKVAVEKIHSLGDFSFVQLALISYPPPKGGSYLTVDLVDPEDAAKRINFLVDPTGDVPDPSHLLQEWDAYQNLSLQLEMAGEVQRPFDCPAFHCLCGFSHPKLVHFGELFQREAPKHAEELFQMFHEDRNPKKRAAAAFLLAHTSDGKKLVRELSMRIRDSSAEVRNNVMRVFTNIGFAHPEIKLPLSDVIQALSFPTTTDRNKALAILASLAKQADLKKEITAKLGEQLIEILQLKQPNNHDWAYATLLNLSSEKFGESDIEAWKDWLANQKRASISLF